MTKDEIILMADASGLSYYGMNKDREKFIYYLEAFAALVTALEQPQQQAEPCIGKDPRCPCQDGDACHYKDCGGTKALPVAQPAQEPVAYYHPRNGFYWAKPTSIFAPTVVDVPPMPLYTAAERNNG